MSFKVEHAYEGIQVRPETFVFPSMLQGHVTKSSQWEPVVINLVDEIDSDTATSIALQLRKAEDNGQSFVPFYIDSPGGSVYGLLSIVESMRRCKIPIYTFTSGIAASCAACVFCMGTRRFMTKYSRLLLHDVSVDFSSETSMTSSNIKVEANEMRTLNRTILQIIAENTGHPTNYFVNLIKTKRNNDIYVSAKQAMEWKMATDIGFPIVEVTHSTLMSVSIMDDPIFNAEKNAGDGAEDSDQDKDDSDEEKESHPVKTVKQPSSSKRVKSEKVDEPSLTKEKESRALNECSDVEIHKFKKLKKKKMRPE